MCEHLTRIGREDDGSISATCAIKDIEKYPKQTQKIMATYHEKSGKTAIRNNECQFYHESQKRNDPDFITECPCNPRNTNFITECPCNR